MRLSVRLVIALSSVVLAAVAVAQDNFAYYPYVVDQFSTYLKLEKDSTLLVTEVIEVTFNESRHGIYRRIPFEYDTGKGIVRRTLLDHIEVVDVEGKPYTTKVTTEGAFVRIRIGDANVELPQGTHKTYAISYRVQNEVNWFDKEQDWEPYAELYWNLTGNDWDTVIKSFRFECKFPDSANPRAKILAGYTGSTAANFATGVGKVSANDETRTSISLQRAEVSGERTEPLNPGEGVTLVLNVPESAVAKPSSLQQAWWVMSANAGFFVPFLVFAILFPAWLVKGRDPKGKPCEVMFEPAEGMSATECGALVDQRVDMRDVSAGLITLAVKGYLTIHPSGRPNHAPSGFTIKLTGKAAEPDLGPFETLLFSKLKAAGPEIDKSDLTTYVGTEISTLKNTVYNSLVTRGYYHQAPQDAAVNGCLVALGITALLIFVLHKLFSAGADETSYILGGLVSIALIALYVKIIPRRTQKGADARNQVAGFENAMRGRKNYMEWVADKQIADVKYEEYLPYAIAFGLVDQWSDTFREVVTHTPTWYVSPYPYDTWSLSHFGNDLNSVSYSAGVAANTPPRTSSSGGSSGFSSGGGFSGGGFGGGGGGSW